MATETIKERGVSEKEERRQWLEDWRRQEEIDRRSKGTRVTDPEFPDAVIDHAGDWVGNWILSDGAESCAHAFMKGLGELDLELLTLYGAMMLLEFQAQFHAEHIAEEG